MSAAHTPGPWEVQDSDQWRAESRDTSSATFCHIGPIKGLAVALAVSDDCDDEGREVEANARLIAASPDMLAALERLAAAGEATLAAMDAYNETNGTHIGGYVFFEIGRGVADARAAIAKALGRTPNEIGDEG